MINYRQQSQGVELSGVSYSNGLIYTKNIYGKKN